MGTRENRRKENLDSLMPKFIAAKVLIVEDNPDFSKIVGATLHFAGHEVIEIVDGQEESGRDCSHSMAPVDSGGPS